MPLPPRLLTAVCLLGGTGLCLALPPAIPPQVETSALPAAPLPWSETNPYRGNPLAAAIGHAAFGQACSGCHGPDAEAARAPAPDLRRIGRACKRVDDPALQQRCLRDADVYFRDSVRQGKVKVGVRHMAAWEGILTPELVWAIRTFVESSAAGPDDRSLSPALRNPAQ